MRDEAAPGLARLGRAYADFAAALGGERRLLRRRCFCVVPADPGLSWADTRAQLASRCDDLAEGLARLGMPAERLTTDGLVALEAACWRPGEAWAAAPWARRRPPARGGGRARPAPPLGRPGGGAGRPLPRRRRRHPSRRGHGRRRRRRAGSWCGRWCPAPCAPPRLAAWVDGGPADPEEVGPAGRRGDAARPAGPRRRCGPTRTRSCWRTAPAPGRPPARWP